MFAYEVLSALIWFQTVCKSNQQATLVAKSQIRTRVTFVLKTFFLTLTYVLKTTVLTDA